MEIEGDFNRYGPYGVAVSAHDSSHDRVRAIDPIGGDLSIKLDLRCLPVITNKDS